MDIAGKTADHIRRMTRAARTKTSVWINANRLTSKLHSSNALAKIRQKAQQRLDMRFFVLFLILSGYLLTYGAYSTLSVQRRVSSSGTITAINVAVYWDSQCTNITATIPWGKIEPGSTFTRIVYVRNTGNTALTLTMSASNWNPPQASAYIAVAWDRQGTILPAGSVTRATLTLDVSDTITGVENFSLDICFGGTG